MSDEKPKGFIPKHVPFVERIIPLDGKGRRAYITLPEDFNQAEAERLAEIIRSIAIDW